MRKLQNYAEKSSLMTISVERDGEIFKFNLFEEIQINEAAVSKELKSQPSSYAFLTMLHTELLRKLALSKVEEEKAYANAYLKNKRSINSETNRPNSDDVAKAKAELDAKYLMSQRKVININANCSMVGNCVKAFEQRASMLQTLSANKRKEN